MATRLQIQTRIPLGNRNALCNHIYAQHRRRIYGLCLWMLADAEAADRLAQLVFTRCLRLLQQGLSPSELEEQLDRYLIFHLRARATHGRSEVRLPPARPRRRLDHFLSASSLIEALQALPAEPRLLLLLHDWLGYTADKVADLMGMETGHCKRGIFDARLRLRSHLLHA